MFRMPATSELAEPSKMTAEQLKAELSSYNLEVTGRKQLLVDRVTKHRKEMLLREEAENAEGDEAGAEALDDSPPDEEGASEQQEDNEEKMDTGDIKEEKEEEENESGNAEIKEEEIKEEEITEEEKEEEIEKEKKKEPELADIVDRKFLMLKISFGALSNILRNSLKSKSLVAYPVSAAELAGEFLTEYVKKCCSYSLKFTPTSINRGHQGYLSMRFTKEEDFKATSDALKEWKSDIQVENKSDRKGGGRLIKDMADDHSKVFLPGDRFVCVAGTPPSITEEKLLDILPGYSATVCLDKAEQHTGICFVEFGGPEDAQEAVDAAQDKLTHDGHKFYAFQLNHCPLASPALGGVMSKKDILAKLYTSVRLRLKVLDNWTRGTTMEAIRSMINDIERIEKDVVADAELRQKYHLPHPDIWLSYLQQEMNNELQHRPRGVQPLGTLPVDELLVRLTKREANKNSRSVKRANKLKRESEAKKDDDDDIDDSSEDGDKAEEGAGKKKTPNKKFQKRPGGYERGPNNKRQRGGFSPGRGGNFSGGMSRGGQGGRGYGGRGRGYNNTGNMGMSHNQGYGHSRGGYSGGYNSQPGYGYNNVNDIKDKAVDILNKLTNVLSVTGDMQPRQQQGNYGNNWNRQQSFQGRPQQNFRGGYY